MARMGEVRSQIQSLEGERNDQLRLKFLEKEVQWLRAIHISNEITQITNSLDSLQNDFDNDALIGIDLLGVNRDIIFLSKTFSCLIFVFTMELVLVIPFIALLGFNPFSISLLISLIH